MGGQAKAITHRAVQVILVA
jgi:hypothetical protein